MVRLVAEVAGCLPVAWHDDRFFACIAGTRDGSESLCHRFPYRAMASFRACKSMSDFMQQCIQNLFRGIVTSVVLGNLNPSITKFAYTLLTFRLRQSKHPVVQAMLHEFPLSNGFQFPQIHTYVPVNRATSFSRTSPIQMQVRCIRRASEPGIFFNSWCKHLNRNATPARTCLPPCASLRTTHVRCSRPAAGLFSILDGHRKPFQSVVANACHCFKTCKAGDANLGLASEIRCPSLRLNRGRKKQRNRLSGAIEWAMSDSREAMTSNSLGYKFEVMESTEILSRDATTGVHGAGKRDSMSYDVALRKECLPVGRL